MKKILITIISLSAFLFGAEGNAPHLDGSELSILWVIPFVGILLSIAIFPLLSQHFWHQTLVKFLPFGLFSLWCLFYLVLDIQ